MAQLGPFRYDTRPQELPEGQGLGNPQTRATMEARDQQLEDYLQRLKSTILARFPIVTADITDGAVTSAKILDGTIATADIADSAITSAKILDGTIATADIAAGAVTPAKLAIPSCHTRTSRTSNIVGIASGGNNLMTWEAETWDYQGMWTSGAPTLITVPVSGFYSVTYFVVWNDVAASFRTAIWFEKVSTGATIRWGEQYALSTSPGMGQASTEVVWVEAGDSLRFYYFHNRGANYEILAGTRATVTLITPGVTALA